MVAPIIAFGVWKAVAWIGGMAIAAWTAKSAIDKFGDNPQNKLARQGISPEQQHNEWQEFLRDRKKYNEEKTDEFFKDIKERNRDLQEENKGFAQQMANTDDPQEKARFLAMMQANKKEIAENNRTIAEHVNKLNKNFEGFGRAPLTQTQFQAKAQQPNLDSWKNWGIIIFCGFIAVMLITFVKKQLDKFGGKGNQ